MVANKKAYATGRVNKLRCTLLSSLMPMFQMEQIIVNALQGTGCTEIIGLDEDDGVI